MPLKYLYTGFPHSGTGYTAKLLSAHGVPAGHESVLPAGEDWRPGGGGGGQLVAEVNGHAGLHRQLDSGRMFQGLTVVHLVRHPVLVLASIRGKIDPNTLIESSVRAWLNAQDYVEEHAAARCRVECPAEVLAPVGIQLAGPPKFTNTQHNSHRGAPSYRALTWHDMPAVGTELGDALRERAERYGYSAHALTLKENQR